MLKSFRNLLEGPGRWIFLILLCAAFGVFGVPALENFGGSSAVTVGKQEVSARDLELEVRNQVARIQQQNPSVTRDQLMSAGIGQQALDTLIVRALLEEEARKLGIGAPDEVVQAYIRQLDGLTDPETGRFQQERLALFLQQERMTPGMFGDMMRSEIIRNQLIGALGANAPAPEELTRYYILRRLESREVRYALLPSEGAAAEPTDEEIEAAYQASLDQYQTPEYRTLTVLTITEDDVASEVTVSEDDLQQLYNARVGAEAAAETRSIRQILVPAASADEAAALAADGADLAAIAEATSARITTLNDQLRSTFVNEDLAEAVFAAEEGALVGPISTDFGTVFAEVASISASQGRSFEEMREELEAELRSEISQDSLIELVEEFEGQRDLGVGIEAAAETVGLEARTEGPLDRELITRFGAIANVPAALGQEAFLLAEGEESRSVRLEDGYGFVTVEQITPPAPRPLTEVRSEVVAALKAERRENAANELKARFQALLAQDKDFAAAATELGGTVETVTFGPGSQPEGLPAGLAPQAANASVSELFSFGAADNQVVVGEVTGVSFEQLDALEAVLPQFAVQIGQSISGELSQAYLEALQESTNVKQNARQIARGLGQDTQ
ncbi:hypothetical protein HK107_15430 [Parvularcula sp. ZS-1/3]|uniref:Parvulin-like PPIase n=1 Tax=Parvularcula mediterranea TaxID=2732508 RepID=A0A7Y3W6U3_9PROT|nr:peptidylprolyl isomerase [Parvularcula mediterranea]NNU17722.1 hypothetical protein [Parvularcula mediterranea]